MIVETIVLWGLIQSPGLVLLCKGTLWRILGFFFLLACEVCLLAVPIIAEISYAVDQSVSLGDLASLLYAEFAFYVLTLIIALLMTLSLCCCGGSDD